MTNANLTIIPTSVMCDFYKITHKMFYPEGTTEIYSTWTPRSSAYFSVKTNYAVPFGFQIFAKKYLVKLFNENFFNRSEDEVAAEYEYVIENTLGGVADSSHIRALHRLGYLPLEIKAVPEGTKIPIKVPTLTIHNTLPEFYWLTNYFETLMSSELWLPSNSATIASRYREDLEKWALFTTGSTDGVAFQGHDFSFRGMQGLDSAVSSGLGHLLSFTGTDNIPAIVAAELYYNSKLSDGLIGTSVPATEHSIMSSFGRDEVKAFDTIIDRVPTGIVSIVSDTYDFWGVLTDVLPTLKDKIMNRDGKVVIRPDSGDPTHIICGTTYIVLNLNPYYVEGKDSVTDYQYLVTNAIKESVEGRRAELSTSTISRGRSNILLGDSVYTVPWERTNKNGFVFDFDNMFKKDETPSEKGTIRLLWETFGGTITEKGYRLLDSHIGLLYGDAITLDRANKISETLANNGFASTNVVFGIGSFTYTFVTRDSLGYALKATYAKINGEEVFIQKDPKTDLNNLKKSLTGKVAVINTEEGIKVVDHLNDEQEANYPGNMLQTIFKDGKLYNEVTLQDVKNNLHNS